MKLAHLLSMALLGIGSSGEVVDPRSPKSAPLFGEYHPRRRYYGNGGGKRNTKAMMASWDHRLRRKDTAKREKRFLTDPKANAARVAGEG